MKLDKINKQLSISKTSMFLRPFDYLSDGWKEDAQLIEKVTNPKRNTHVRYPPPKKQKTEIYHMYLCSS